MKYIVQLSEEIQAMEGGDLDHPITVQGSDELTTLASSLDSMRLTLRQQHEDEAAAAAKVKNLITEMSHDLRTPLTTLLLYTEILRHRKYETTAQAEDYLAKIDTKARQLKQLSDNLFEYALVTRDTVAVLDPPARFSQIFEEPLTEMVGELQERGFACALELGEEDDTLTVKSSTSAASSTTSPRTCSNTPIRRRTFPSASSKRTAKPGLPLKMPFSPASTAPTAPRSASPASRP